MAPHPLCAVCIGCYTEHSITLDVSPKEMDANDLTRKPRERSQIVREQDTEDDQQRTSF